MTAVDRDTLKTYFETGDRPTQSQFTNLIDSPLTLSASLGAPIHSSACLQAASTISITQTGSVIRFDATGGGREVLTANRTYYVRTDGNDSNGGLTNSAASAFLTIQKAIDIVGTIDISIYNVTIQIIAGTYSAGISVIGPWVGSGTVTIVGDTALASNVIISGTGTIISAAAGAQISISGIQVTTSGDACLYSTGNSRITVSGSIIFVNAATRHCWAESAAKIQFDTNYAIAGSAGAYHYFVITGGAVACLSKTISISTSPAFPQVFAYADRIGVIEAHGSTYSGSVSSGKRYDAQSNAVVFTNGGGAAFFPGASAGTTSTGGQYI